MSRVNFGLEMNGTDEEECQNFTEECITN